MLAKTNACTLLGIEGHAVEVEVDISLGLPEFHIVGLPDTAVREAKDRVRSAIKNSGFKFPTQRITVNLAPADIRKEGSLFDLSIAMGILAASGQLAPHMLNGCFFLGELSLDGSLRSACGILPLASSLNPKKCLRLFVPAANAAEAALTGKNTVFGVKNLFELVSFCRGEIELVALNAEGSNYLNLKKSNYSEDFSDVKGQDFAKRALEIAAAGNHNVLLWGPPGSGKTMLARRLPTILPSLSLEESLEVTKIYSVAGFLPPNLPLITERPFRSPHHSATAAGIIGGGRVPRPGEVSLAHNGVLFLDEFPEYSRQVLETLRQPLEDKVVTITRASTAISYPCNFTLVAAMNPCPCGNYGNPFKRCTCAVSQIKKYNQRVSGPLVDRIDLQIEVPPLEIDEVSKVSGGESSADIRSRVEECRRIQRERYKGTPTAANGDMNTRQLKQFCALSREGENLMRSALKHYGLSMRGRAKILKVARTIADLNGETKICSDHIAEAIQYRCLDRLS